MANNSASAATESASGSRLPKNGYSGRQPTTIPIRKSSEYRSVQNLASPGGSRLQGHLHPPVHGPANPSTQLQWGWGRFTCHGGGLHLRAMNPRGCPALCAFNGWQDAHCRTHGLDDTDTSHRPRFLSCPSSWRPAPPRVPNGIQRLSPMATTQHVPPIVVRPIIARMPPGMAWHTRPDLNDLVISRDSGNPLLDDRSIGQGCQGQEPRGASLLDTTECFVCPEQCDLPCHR